jgi:hypothetical protein
MARFRNLREVLDEDRGRAFPPGNVFRHLRPLVPERHHLPRNPRDGHPLGRVSPSVGSASLGPLLRFCPHDLVVRGAPLAALAPTTVSPRRYLAVSLGLGCARSTRRPSATCSLAGSVHCRWRKRVPHKLLCPRHLEARVSLAREAQPGGVGGSNPCSAFILSKTSPSCFAEAMKALLALRCHSRRAPAAVTVDAWLPLLGGLYGVHYVDTPHVNLYFTPHSATESAPCSRV